jgi:hypothetical protein
MINYKKIDMKILFLGTLLLLAINSFGQKSSEKASKDICECVEKKLSNTKQLNVKDSVNSCFGQAMAVHMDGLNKEFKIKSVTVESVMETRDRLLKVLRKKCTYFKQ